MRKQLKKNTTNLQCAGFVASIGCPRIWEICNDFGHKLTRRRLRYVECEQAARERAARNHAAAIASGWVFEDAL